MGGWYALSYCNLFKSIPPPPPPPIPLLKLIPAGIFFSLSPPPLRDDKLFVIPFALKLETVPLPIWYGEWDDFLTFSFLFYEFFEFELGAIGMSRRGLFSFWSED